MKLDFTLSVSIPVHVSTLTIHNDAKYNFDDYYEEHLRETLEDMVKAFLTEKMHSIVVEASKEVEENMSEMMG